MPRWDTRPEWTIGTSDEDKPVLSKGDLQEQDLVADTKVLDDTTVFTVDQHGGEGDPSTDGKNTSEKDRHTPELGKVPLDGSLGVGSVVVGNGKRSNIGENGNEDDEVQVEGLIHDRDPKTQEDLQVKRQGDTVDNVGVHAVEDLTGGLESVNDSGETRSQEDDISSRTGSIRCTLDGNTSVGLLERWSVVDTITSHSNQVTTLLQDLDDIVLVLGEDLSETIGSLNEIVNLRTGHVTTTTKTKTFSIVDVCSKTELAGSLTSNTDGVTSQHLDGETKSLSFVDSLCSVVSWGVRARHDTENLPMAFTTLAGNTEGTETTGSEFSNLVLVVIEDLLIDGVVFLNSAENEERGTLNTDDTLALGRLDNGSNLLGDGIEGVEFKDLVSGENVLGTWVVSERLQESLVNGIETLLLAGSSQTSSQHEIISLNTIDCIWLSKGELVLGKGTSLVRAEDFDTSKRLNGGELLDDSLLLGKVGSTDGHGGSDDSWETDWNTNDSDGESEFQNVNNSVVSVERGNPDDEKS